MWLHIDDLKKCGSLSGGRPGNHFMACLCLLHLMPMDTKKVIPLRIKRSLIRVWATVLVALVITCLPVLRPIIRRFLSDNYIMRVAFAQASTSDANELGLLLHVLDCCR